MDRRTVLRGGMLGLGGAAVTGMVGCAPSPGGPSVDLGPFDCGVASGVHAEDAVVLWTRFAPAASGNPVDLRWRVATDPDLVDVVLQGNAAGSADSDGCVKVLATGLEPGRTYWYGFDIDGLASPVGRTRTLPAPGSDPASVRLAVASCQSWAAGYYPAWRAIAAEDVDAVVFLGDYIYESAGGGAGPFTIRSEGLGTARDLAGYRSKYRLYRSDPDLRAAHAAHPFAPIWDDHEFVNDYDRSTILAFPDRAAAAYRAWFEYQPVWRIDGDRTYRRLQWGQLLDLAMLDTRQYRDPHVVGADGEGIKFGPTPDQPMRLVHSVGRTILGDAQRDWFLDGFGEAQADGITWKLVANQVMISPIRVIDLDEPVLRALNPDLPEHAGVYANFDDWSGHMWERDVVTDRLHSDGISNVGFLTGDIHSFWQASVARDYDEALSPVVAQEFVCGSVSSRGVDYVGDLAEGIGDAIRGFSPGFRYVDLVRRGFGMVECTPERASVEFRTVDTTSGDPAAWGAQPRRRVRFDWPAGTHDIAMTLG